MPSVLITPEGLLDRPGKYQHILTDGGLDHSRPKNRQLARGLLSQEETIDEMRGFAGVIAGGEIFSPAVLNALPDLRVIARCGVGFDRVDIPAATERGIAVTITPTANHEAVAEQAITLLFAVAKSLVKYDQKMRQGGWREGLLKPVRGSVLGVFGLGRIGRSMARKSLGLGMRVIAHDAYPDTAFAEEHSVELVDFDTLLAQSDYVSIHAPLNEHTEGLFNREVFAKMKAGSVLLNTARGPLVKEADLVEALQSGHLSGAGLDVFEQEPTPAKHPLFELDNVALSPHVAGLDERAQDDMANEAADCIVKLSRGEWPEGAVVNNELKGSWKW